MHDIADSRYPHIVHEPRKGPADARVLGTGMHAWEIDWTARHYEGLDARSKDLDVDLDLLEEGMAYAAEHPAEVAAAIAENDSWTFERLQQALPAIQLFPPPGTDNAEDSG